MSETITAIPEEISTDAPKTPFQIAVQQWVDDGKKDMRKIVKLLMSGALIDRPLIGFNPVTVLSDELPEDFTIKINNYTLTKKEFLIIVRDLAFNDHGVSDAVTTLETQMLPPKKSTRFIIKALEQQVFAYLSGERNPEDFGSEYLKKASLALAYHYISIGDNKALIVLFEKGLDQSNENLARLMERAILSKNKGVIGLILEKTQNQDSQKMGEDQFENPSHPILLACGVPDFDTLEKVYNGTIKSIKGLSLNSENLNKLFKLSLACGNKELHADIVAHHDLALRKEFNLMIEDFNNNPKNKKPIENTENLFKAYKLTLAVMEEGAKQALSAGRIQDQNRIFVVKGLKTNALLLAAGKTPIYKIGGNLEYKEKEEGSVTDILTDSVKEARGKIAILETSQVVPGMIGRLVTRFGGGGKANLSTAVNTALFNISAVEEQCSSLAAKRTVQTNEPKELPTHVRIAVSQQSPAQQRELRTSMTEKRSSITETRQTITPSKPSEAIIPTEQKRAFTDAQIKESFPQISVGGGGRN